MADSSNKKDSKQALRDSLRKKMTEAEARDEEPQAEENASDSLKTPPSDQGKVRMPEALAAEKEKEEKGGILHKDIFVSTPGLEQMAVFCRQLATLIEVGIPLVQALNTLALRIEHPKLKTIVADVARRVEEGSSFSDALAAHPKVFSALVVNVVRIGESGGILEGSLQYLADLMEKRYQLRQQVRSAMTYPSFVLIVCGLVILIIMSFVLPAFRDIFDQLGSENIPALTKFMMGLSDILKNTWWLVILIVAGAIFGLRYLIKTNEGIRHGWNRLVLKAPVTGPIAVKVNVTRSCRTLAQLLRAGVPLLEALQLTAETSENTVVGEMFAATHDHVEAGGRIDEPMRKADIFPALVVDMIAIGEEAGRLDMIFQKVAETYEADVQHSIATLHSVLEPVLILVMGTIVALIALTVFMPLWTAGLSTTQ